MGRPPSNLYKIIQDLHDHNFYLDKDRQYYIDIKNTVLDGIYLEGIMVFLQQIQNPWYERVVFFYMRYLIDRKVKSPVGRIVYDHIVQLWAVDQRLY